MPEQISSEKLTQAEAYRLVDVVSEQEGLAWTASAYEIADTADWIFQATCDDNPDLDAFAVLARATFGRTIAFSAEKLDPNINWVARSLEGLRPVVAGGFYVYGSHETEPVPHGVIGLKIDAAQAFGTGHHETTAGCLQAIDRVLKRETPRAAIDIGTGTGVLAIAIAKRTRRAVIATDIDPIAVKTTRENARENGVAGLIVPIEATGLTHKEIAAGAPYDLLVANILAGPLVKLAPAMGRAAARGATIILSGILVHQAQRVLAAYRPQGMVLKTRLIKKEWATLVLEKH